MKNLNLILFLCLLVLAACETNQDITTTEDIIVDPIQLNEIEISGRVYAYPNDLHRYGFGELHNASVKLIYNGEVLDETNTDGVGEYSFAPQIAPEGTYVLVTAPGYYPNTRKIDPALSSTTFNLMPTYFGDFSGSGIDENLEVVRIRGSLQEDNLGSSNLFYFVNENNELIGNYVSDAALEFDITTVAGTEVFLYHHNQPECPANGPVALGAFSNDVYIGNVYEQSSNDYKNKIVEVYGKARACNGTPLTHNDGYYLVKYGNSTVSSIQDRLSSEPSDRLFYADKCALESSPEIIITAVDAAASLFGEYVLTYTGEEVIENIEIPTCQVDDTFFALTVGTQDFVLDNFTVANITTDGRIILKQIAVSHNPTDGNVSIELPGTGAPGTYNGDLTFYLSRSAGGVAVGTENLTVTITANDGEFLEGAISGAVYDADEVLLGNGTGTFRARIQ